MKGRQRGRPTKWVLASIDESVWLSRSGVTFEVWDKWKKKRRKIGTLIVSVGGLRWLPHKSPAHNYRQQSWRSVDEWFQGL